MSKTAIFLDGAYIEKILETHFAGVRINFGKLTQYLLTGEQELLRAYYYHCPPYLSSEPTPEEIRRYDMKMGFFHALGHFPRFQIRLGKLAFRGYNNSGRPIFIQKSVDVLLAVDMVQLAATKSIDRIILLAGDSDFSPAIEAVKSHGVITTLVHAPPQGRYNGADTLWDICDERIVMDQSIIEQIRQDPKGG